MSRKNVAESFATKTTRNDRFAQMSRQEQVIEQKKREIQARLLQQKDKSVPVTASTTKPSTTDTKKSTKLWKGNLGSKPTSNSNNKTSTQFNMFSNDGSFLDQFKQLSDNKKGFDQKITISSLVKADKTRDNQERINYSDERNKSSRWSKVRTQPSILYSEESPQKNKVSRFSDPVPDTNPPVVTFAPNFPDIFSNSFNVQPPMNVIPNVVSITSLPVTSTGPLLVPPPMTMPVPPPQLVQANNVGALIAPPPPNPALTGINVPPPVISVQNTIQVPPPCIQAMELASIPAPNPIPVHTIPQPEPINTLTIPPPAPLQLQNIPSPSPIRLNEIPNPKPLDLLNIPAPVDEPKLSKSITDPDFIKNVPPPNKSVPPPNLGTVTITELPNISMPPPSPRTCLPPPFIHIPMGSNIVTTPVSNPSIPPLMAQPILPPPGLVRPPAPPPAPLSQPIMSIPPPVNMAPIPGPPPVLNQPPPLAQTSQIPPMNFPPPLGPPPSINPPPHDMNSGSTSHDAMVSLGRMVAQCGMGIEDVVRQRSTQDPRLWFLFHKQSAAYQQYRQMVDQFCGKLNPVNTKDQEYQPEDLYEPENVTDDETDVKCKNQLNENDDIIDGSRKRKRKSRWGDKVNAPNPLSITPTMRMNRMSPMLTKITRTDPGLIQYAVTTFGSTNLTEEEWEKAEDHFKINLLYQEMVRKREEIERLKRAGKNKYEYDSDEEMDGGTWEHKLRMQEMEATQLWANELTRQAEGKHHIGDFLPPEELKRFMEKYSAVKDGRQPNLSDYKEFKLKEDNIGFKMLQKLGWSEGQGLGTEGTGIVDPVNKAPVRDQNQGLGLQQAEHTANNDDEYDAYRKRMMLAYRFRPNPLNNPRRPYY